jgi:hypothetical protein
MEKEDYVSLEVAKLLKEKGYPQEYNVGTLCRLQNKANQYYEKTRAIAQSDIDNAWCVFNEIYPTLYETQKWIRTNHNIHIEIGNCGSGYYWSLNKANSGRFVCDYLWNGLNDGGCWDTYEEALNAGILEALKMI